ncbi:hypothetical protein [Nostoc sp.]|uniref:hypothetical protein n=1 Tax=Nostoc sp. TaxID=1180 RepID=UPI002FF52F95
MKKITEINRQTVGVILVIFTTLIFGSIPAVVKEAITIFSPATQFAIRFAIAAIILTPFIRNLNVRHHVKISCANLILNKLLVLILNQKCSTYFCVSPKLST